MGAARGLTRVDVYFRLSVLQLVSLLVRVVEGAAKKSIGPSASAPVVIPHLPKTGRCGAPRILLFPPLRQKMAKGWPPELYNGRGKIWPRSADNASAPHGLSPTSAKDRQMWGTTTFPRRRGRRRPSFCPSRGLRAGAAEVRGAAKGMRRWSSRSR